MRWDCCITWMPDPFGTGTAYRLFFALTTQWDCEFWALFGLFLASKTQKTQIFREKRARHFLASYPRSFLPPPGTAYLKKIGLTLTLNVRFWPCFYRFSITKNEKTKIFSQKTPWHWMSSSLSSFSPKAYTSIGVLTLPKNGSFLAVFYRISIMKDEKTQIFRQKRPCQNLAGRGIIYYYVRRESEHRNKF